MISWASVPLRVFERFRDLEAVGRAVLAGVAGRRRRVWFVGRAVFCFGGGGLGRGLEKHSSVH